MQKFLQMIQDLNDNQDSETEWSEGEEEFKEMDKSQVWTVNPSQTKLNHAPCSG